MFIKIELFFTIVLSSVPLRQASGRAAAFMEWLNHLSIEKDIMGISVNGWIQGAQYFKYPNGQLSEEEYYVDGTECGPKYAWNEKGALIAKVDCINSKNHRRFLYWNERGELIIDSAISL